MSAGTSLSPQADGLQAQLQPTQSLLHVTTHNSIGSMQALHGRQSVLMGSFCAP